MLPHKVKISLAFGEVVRVPKPQPGFPEPAPAEVERVHAEYVRSLRAGFDKHKAARYVSAPSWRGFCATGPPAWPPGVEGSPGAELHDAHGRGPLGRLERRGGCTVRP